jgi:hypothetical protein
MIPHQLSVRCSYPSKYAPMNDTYRKYLLRRRPESGSPQSFDWLLLQGKESIHLTHDPLDVRTPPPKKRKSWVMDKIKPRRQGRGQRVRPTGRRQNHPHTVLVSPQQLERDQINVLIRFGQVYAWPQRVYIAFSPLPLITAGSARSRLRSFLPITRYVSQLSVSQNKATECLQ